MKKIITLWAIIIVTSNVIAQSALSKMQPYFSNDPKKDLANGSDNNVWQYGIGGKFSKLANNVYIQLTPTKYYNVSTNDDGSTVYEDEFDLIKQSDDVYIFKLDQKNSTKRIIVLNNYTLFKIEAQTYTSPYTFKLLSMYMCGTNKRYGTQRSFVGGFGAEWEGKNQAYLNGGTYFNSGVFQNEVYAKMMASQKTSIENAIKGAKDNQAAAEAKKLKDMEDAASANDKKIKEQNAIKRVALLKKFGEATLFTNEYLKWKEKGNPKLTAFYTNKGYFSRWANAIKATNGYISEKNWRQTAVGETYDESGTIIYQGTGLDARIACYRNKEKGYDYISIKNFGEFDKVDLWDTHTSLTKYKQSYLWLYMGYDNKYARVQSNPIGALFWVKGNLIHYNTADYRFKVFNVWTYPGATHFELKSPTDYHELQDYYELIIMPAQLKAELK
jgi:hypothetical protein